MNNEKAGVRFCIQFSRTDPAHLHVAKILKSKARGDKAKYIVNAVLYYESHCGASDVKHMTLIDENHLESAVNRILLNREKGSTGILSAGCSVMQVHKQPKHVENAQYEDDIDALGVDGLSSISNTMSMFQKK